jgi:hypothetical protein
MATFAFRLVLVSDVDPNALTLQSNQNQSVKIEYSQHVRRTSLFSRSLLPTVTLWRRGYARHCVCLLFVRQIEEDPGKGGSKIIRK